MKATEEQAFTEHNSLSFMKQTVSPVRSLRNKSTGNYESLGGTGRNYFHLVHKKFQACPLEASTWINNFS